MNRLDAYPPLRQREAFIRLKEKKIMPLITITQNFGSNGLAIARKVAEGLGCELFDDQKLHALVRQKGISA